MTGFALFVDGLDSLEEVGRIRADLRTAASRALNKVARDQRAFAAREITRQVNLPKNYVSPSQGRLAVNDKASPGRLQASIRARGRATSLARFAVGSPGTGRAGVTVAVKPGQATFLRRAFLIRLPGVGGSTDPGLGNTGLAIRLRPGERLQNKVQQVRLAKNLYLLYGPSVSQVFLDNSGNGVARDAEDRGADQLQREFLRLIKL